MNFAAVIEDHASETVALVAGSQTVTYDQLCRQVAAVRGALLASGVERGDRVAIPAAISVAFVVDYLAALGVGAVVVPLNPASPPPELLRELGLVGARFVLAAPGPADEIWRSAAMLPIDTAGTAGELAPTSRPGAPAFGRPPIVELDESAAAVAVYTSGTAGAPRAALLTHGNLLVNLRQMRAHAGGAAALRPDDVVLIALPLFHVFGLNATLGAALHAGACCVLMDEFHPKDALALIKQHRITIATGVPPMWAALAAVEGATPIDVASIRLAGSGGARLALQVRRAVRERLNLEIEEGYGLSETAPIVALSVGTGAPAGSIGRPVPGVELRLVDSSGFDVLVNDPGEVWIKGPNVFAGYFGDPEATRAVLTDTGWLRTGDLAVINEAGFLFLVDRIKDLVIVSGFNVYPAEVEEVLLAHGGVASAAVVGVPDDRTGEAVHAYVVRSSTGLAVTAHELIEWVARHVARYKCPALVRFVEDLPINASGKIRHAALRDRTSSASGLPPP